MDRLAFIVLVLAFKFTNAEKYEAGPECKLPLDLPVITAIQRTESDTMVHIKISLESEYEIEAFAWHTSSFMEYRFLPVINGVDDTTVVSSMSRASPSSPLILNTQVDGRKSPGLSYSLLLKVKFPCVTAQLIIQYLNTNVTVPIKVGRILAMPPDEIISRGYNTQVRYEVVTEKGETGQNHTDDVLFGPQTVEDMKKFNVPWQGQVQSPNRADLAPRDSNALYEYQLSHQYANDSVAVTLMMPLVVTKDSRTKPQFGFIACDPKQKMDAKMVDGVINMYQEFGHPTCLKFEFINGKNAFISMRRKKCTDRSPGERLEPAFGTTDYRFSYVDQTYYLKAPRMWQYPNDEVCYTLRAVNGWGGEEMMFKMKFFHSSDVTVGVNKVSDVDYQLTCTAYNGGSSHQVISFYKGNLEDYYNSQRIVLIGEEAESQWMDLKDTGMVSSIQGNASPGIVSKSYGVILTRERVRDLKNANESLFCVVKTEQEYIVEKFDISGETFDRQVNEI